MMTDAQQEPSSELPAAAAEDPEEQRREDFEAEDAEILRQAWDVLRSDCDAKPMSVEADPNDTHVR